MKPVTTVRLSELEELILVFADMLGSEAYPLRFAHAMRSQRQRRISIAAIHATLNKLEQKHFLLSTLGESTVERGGRRKRLYHVTAEGRNALEAFWKLHGITVISGNNETKPPTPV